MFNASNACFAVYMADDDENPGVYLANHDNLAQLRTEMIELGTPVSVHSLRLDGPTASEQRKLLDGLGAFAQVSAEVPSLLEAIFLLGYKVGRKEAPTPTARKRP